MLDKFHNVGNKPSVLSAKKETINRVDYGETGNMDEYVGCKFEWEYDNMTLKFT